MRATDLVFGGTAPGFAVERSFNMDDTRPGPFGIGWSSNLTETLTADTDGSLVLRRGSGRFDRFATSGASGGGYFALTGTGDVLSKNSDGSFTLRTPGSAVSRVFSSDGRLLAIQDSGAARVTFDYNSAGALAAARYRGLKIQLSYDSSGRVSSVSDPAGRSVAFTYTADGRLSQQTNPDGRPVTYQYDDSGNLTGVGGIAVAYAGEPGYIAVSSLTTPDGSVRKYDIPSNPTQIRSTDGKGDAALYLSNAAGLLLAATDANGNTVAFTYDASGRRTAAVNPSGDTVKFSYDSSGNLASAQDPGGNRWTADYSGALPARVSDPNGNTWTFAYDAAGNLVSVSDPAGGGLTAARSQAGQVTSIADAQGNKRSWRYSSDGLVTGYTDALGGAWSYQFDGAARVASRIDPSGAEVDASYGPGDRLSGLTSGNAQLAFDYSGLERDASGRIAAYTDSFGNQVRYGYDAAGRLTGLTLPGGKTVAYQYDHARRLTQVTDWAGNFALYRYDAAGYPVSVTVSGGPITVYQYDTARRLRAIVSTGPDGTPVAGYRYAFDANGNRTSVTALEPSAAAVALNACTFTFDAAGHPLTRGDGESYQYDARGNLTSIRGGRNIAFAYDPFGRLQALSGDVSTSYAYDAIGLRVSRTVNGTSRRFVYDVAGTRPRVVAETDGAGAPVAWYVYGLGLLWKVTADGTPYFYHFDGDGNAVALSGTSAGVVNRYRYDPAGRLVSAAEGVENWMRARGEAGWVDDTNGLVFTGTAYQVPDLRLTLPAAADPSPPPPVLLPQFSGLGVCFLDGVPACSSGFAGRDR